MFIKRCTDQFSQSRQSHNTEFEDITITFSDQNDRPLEIIDKVNLILLIKKQKWYVILQKQNQENKLKNMDFYQIILLII